jgi:uncharacterized membrane protein
MPRAMTAVQSARDEPGRYIRGMVDIHHEGSCEAPVEVAFAYVDQYLNATDWMFGLSSFEPVGEQVQGLGAVFDATFAIKPVKLHSTIQVTEWVENEVIAFKSVKGFTNWSTWRFVSEGPTRTKIAVKFGYELPGGLAGKALGRVLEPIVMLSLRHSDENLRREIESLYKSQT